MPNELPPFVRATRTAASLFPALLAFAAAAASAADVQVYRAAADFAPADRGFAAYYPENKAADATVHGLAVNPTVSGDRFAAADVVFDGPAGAYDLRLLAVAAEDGESVYGLLVNDQHLGLRTNLPTTEKRKPVWHSWRGVPLEPGDRLRVLLSNGKYPEGDAFAWSRGRWRILETAPAVMPPPTQ